MQFNAGDTHTHLITDLGIHGWGHVQTHMHAAKDVAA